MAVEAELLLEISADNKKIKQSLEKISKTSKKSGQKAGKKFGSGFSVGLKAAAAAATAALAGVFATRAFINAAKVQEDAVNSLNSALIATGRFTEQASQDFQNYASSLQGVTKFGDEQILQNAALIQSLGNLSQDGLKEATKTALDFASALKIDLRTASNLVGRAAAGDITLFKRYGVTIQRGANNAETFANALKTLNQSFGGAAERDVVTFSAATQQLSNTFGDLLEEIGFLITKNPQVTAFIKSLQQSFSVLITIVKDNADTLKGFVSGFINAFRNSILVAAGAFKIFRDSFSDTGSLAIFGQALEAITNFFSDNFLPILGSAVKIVDFIIVNIQTGFQTLLFGIVKTGQGIDSVLSAIGVDTGFTKNLEILADQSGKILSDLANESKNQFDTLFDASAQAERGQSFLDSFTELIENTKQAATDEETGESVFASIFAPFQQENIDKIIANSQKLKEGLGKNLKQTGNAITKTAKQVSFDLNTRLGNALAGGIQNVVNSLLQGENVFANFAKFVLGTIGDLAIQLGTFFIIQGFAVEALKGIKGAAALAAGAALVALGSLLKGLSGGSGGVAGGGAAAGGGGVGGFAPQDNLGSTVTDQAEEREDPGTSVQVTIQGDVLDSDETGTRIVSLINDAFEKDGVVVRNFAAV